MRLIGMVSAHLTHAASLVSVKKIVYSLLHTRLYSVISNKSLKYT